MDFANHIIMPYPHLTEIWHPFLACKMPRKVDSTTILPV